MSSAAIRLQRKTLIGYGFEGQVSSNRNNTQEVVDVKRSINTLGTKKDSGACLITIGLVGLSAESGELRNNFSDLLQEYVDIFRAPSEELTSTGRVEHRIITESVPPVVKEPYKVPFYRRDEFKKEITPCCRMAL